MKTDKNKTPTLEELLSRALKDNPDIRVAESKLREAEAELNRTRLQVTQKAVALHQALERQKKVVAEATKRLAEPPGQLGAGNRNMVQLSQRRQELEAAKGQLAQTESETQYLLGTQPVPLQPFLKYDAVKNVPSLAIDSANNLYVTYANTLQIVRAPKATAIADKIRAALDKPVSVKSIDVPWSQVLGDLGKDHDIPIVRAMVPGPGPVVAADAKITVYLDQVPLGAVFQAIEDLVGVSFFLRDYGVLVISSNRSAPDGALRLRDFWHSQPTEKKPAAAGEKR